MHQRTRRFVTMQQQMEIHAAGAQRQQKKHSAKAPARQSGNDSIVPESPHNSPVPASVKQRIRK